MGKNKNPEAAQSVVEIFEAPNQKTKKSKKQFKFTNSGPQGLNQASPSIKPYSFVNRPPLNAFNLPTDFQ